MPMRHVLIFGGILLLMLGAALDRAREGEGPPSPWLVFASDRDGDWVVYRMRVDGDLVQKLTHQRGQYNWPAWSPDGLWIAYLYERFGDRQVYRMRPDGSGWEQLTYLEQVSPPLWSADSMWIAFSALRSGKPGVYRMRADGSELLWLTVRPRGVLAFQWAGEWLMAETIYRSDAELYRLHVTGNPTVRATYSEGQDSAAIGSPDGAWVVFVSERDGTQALYRMRPDGSDDAVRLTQITSQPFWSPDSEWIGFLDSDTSGPGIYRIRPDGTGRQRLAMTNGDESFLSWSPDGRWIVFVSRRHGMDNLYLLHVENGEITQLTKNQGHNISPSWGPVVEVPWQSSSVLRIGLLLSVFGAVLYKLR